MLIVAITLTPVLELRRDLPIPNATVPCRLLTTGRGKAQWRCAIGQPRRS